MPDLEVVLGAFWDSCDTSDELGGGAAVPGLG